MPCQWPVPALAETAQAAWVHWMVTSDATSLAGLEGLARLPAAVVNGVLAALGLALARAHSSRVALDRFWRLAGAATHLTRLDLAWLKAIPSEALDLGLVAEFEPACLALLARLPGLLALDLSAPPARSRHAHGLPTVSDELLAGLCQLCPEVKEINLCHQRAFTGSGLAELSVLPLRRILLYQCRTPAAELARVAAHWPHLIQLGCADAGRVLKILVRHTPQGRPLPQWDLSHVNNVGENQQGDAFALRFRASTLAAVERVAPGVRNLRVRVTDADVAGLSELKHLKTVELWYHVGSLHSPRSGTLSFFRVSGAKLTSVAILCDVMTLVMWQTLGTHCPLLEQFWSRSNSFQSGPDVDLPPEGFTRLRIFSWRVGAMETSTVRLQPQCLAYVLRQARHLEQLILAVRDDHLITDAHLGDLLLRHSWDHLEKLLIVVPGRNNLPRILPVGMPLARLAIEHCPQLRTLGNLLSWSVEPDQVHALRAGLGPRDHLEIVYRDMSFH